MKKLLGTLFGFFGGIRGELTLVAICALAAFAWVKWSKVTNERDQAVRFAVHACAIAGQPKADAACIGAIEALAAFERDALRVSNAALAQAQRDRDAKSAADLAASRQAADRAASAIEQLEKADAQVSGDHVGADWFGAVNDAAGLRPSRR